MTHVKPHPIECEESRDAAPERIMPLIERGAVLENPDGKLALVTLLKAGYMTYVTEDGETGICPASASWLSEATNIYHPQAKSEPTTTKPTPLQNAMNAQGVQPATGDAGLREAAKLVVDKWWNRFGNPDGDTMEDDATNNAIADLRLVMMGDMSDLEPELKQALATVAPQTDPDLALREAAQAVVNRWDSPTWKDLPNTGHSIDVLRKALATTPQPKQPNARDAVIAELVAALEKINMGANSDEVSSAALSRARAVSKTEGV